MIELYRAIIPSTKIINDNHGQHYRVQMGSLKWLSNQFERLYNKEEDSPGKFLIPGLSNIKNYTKDKKYISLIFEVWKPTNRRFDTQNYSKTFKAPLDLLVSKGYLEDDSWNYISSVSFRGGGSNVWDRAFRYENDGLPNELTPEWWKKYTDDINGILIRILIE